MSGLEPGGREPGGPGPNGLESSELEPGGHEPSGLESGGLEPGGLEPGSRVCMHYSLVLDNGYVADSSGNEPLEFVLGDGTLEPALEAHLIGLKPPQQREFAIAPGTVFPWPTEAAQQWLAADAFPAGQRIEPGLIFEFNTPAGDVVPGRILAVEGTQVHVDFNHPLAGRAFTFIVELI